MDKAILLNNTTPEKLTKTILEGVKIQLQELKQDFQPKDPDEYLTRKETAKLLKISLVCLHDWCNKGILKPYKMGNRTYFKRKEIENKLNSSNTL